MWIFLVSAWAVEIPEKTGSEIGVGCVAHVQAKAPILVLDHQQYALRDDGKEPDASLDGVFSVFVSTTSQEKVAASLLGDDQKVLWSGDVPLPPKGQQTWLLIDESQKGQRPLVEVKFKPIGSVQGAKVSAQSWWIYWLMVGLGFVLGWYIRRPQYPRIRRWNTLQDKTDIDSKIHVVPEEDVAAVVEQHAQGMLVLLCTSKKRHHIFSDIVHRQSIFLIDDDVPCEHYYLCEQLSILEQLGEAILILDGMHGLVKPLPSESPLVVLNEILNISSHRVCVVFSRDDVPDGVEIADHQNETTASQ